MILYLFKNQSVHRVISLEANVNMFWAFLNLEYCRVDDDDDAGESK